MNTTTKQTNKKSYPGLRSGVFFCFHCIFPHFPCLRHYRITPAHAGNTPFGFSVVGRVRDHLRACGEYFKKAAEKLGMGGSPPRMRGILLNKLRIKPRKRITPAHAGNTPELLTVARLLEDHPRACGEYWKLSFESMQYIGSPPRMRGIPKSGATIVTPKGITPAHAGNTSSVMFVQTPVRDHPRACGEYA